MFHKLDWAHDLSPLRNPELTSRTEYATSQRYGRAMQNVTPNPTINHVVVGAARDYALSLLPAEILAVETPEILHLDMNGIDAQNPSLTAHKDYNRRCALNAYLNANGEITHYYSWDRKRKALEETGRFIAETGDWWLLDTSEVHSVSLIPHKRRLVMSMSFVKTPFDTIKHLLSGGRT